MKKIINNLLYDTHTAYLIHTENESQFLPFCSYDIYTKLYITKHNRFFLYTYESNLHMIFFNSYENIEPLTNDEAFDFMQQYCPEKIKYYFQIKDA